MSANPAASPARPPAITLRWLPRPPPPAKAKEELLVYSFHGRRQLIIPCVFVNLISCDTAWCVYLLGRTVRFVCCVPNKESKALPSFSFGTQSSLQECLLFGPDVRNGRNFSSLSRASYSNAAYLYASPSIEFRQHKVYPRLVHNARKSERCSPVYASGKKGNSTSENTPFSWESLKKAIGGFRRELTVQDMLRERAQERQFDGNGGNGISGGGSGDGSGGPEDEGFAGQFNEFLQVIMALIGVVFLYILMIRGEELTRLARDYIKYLFGAKPSVRLTRAMEEWHKFYEGIAWKGVVREDWLEREIVATPTWWHKPRHLAYLVDTCYESYRKQDS